MPLVHRPFALHSAPIPSEQLLNPTRSTGKRPRPRIIRRAEEFIRTHAGQPIALHEVAEAAGCSVRSLQLGFRQFRGIAPSSAIRQAQLETVRQILAFGESSHTVTDVAFNSALPIQVGSRL